ncbi:murein hydrolase activator EnvC family protein [Undibacterium arcticum]|uniref:Murein hydrolase activator EnvC family protein n=1 Tax=Undibacterium arcticum TaxID=1762892 RepID=A0ABV7F228_9BURK
MATLLLSLSGSTLAASKVTERSKQKSAAEAERAELHDQLRSLKRDISQTESARDSATDTLAESEAAISDANRSLRELGDEQSQTRARLEQLSKQQIDLSNVIASQQQRLAKLLREHYVAGNEDRIKLLLSGDNPNRINRDLQYMGYLSQAQARLVTSLRANLQAVESNKAATQNANDELDEIAQEERDQRALLLKEQARRATLLAQLSSKLSAQRKQAGNLQRDEQRLSGLVDKLALLVEQQQKADAAAQEKRRQQQQAQAKARELEARNQAQRERQRSRQAAGKIKPANPDAIDDDEPAARVVAQHDGKSDANADRSNESKNELSADASLQGAAFAQLRGRLRLPVRGTLAAKFGSTRDDGPSWKGLFIRAAEGSEIKAVAGGRVVFADWLRGFGNLLIIDHGGQYMTIYGNNQSLFKRAGDAIKSGEPIASAGNSGGNEQSGLYFEMRHQGRAFDPLGWVRLSN